MKALISNIENTGDYLRIVQLSTTEFEVTDSLFWIDSPEDLDINTHGYDPVTQQFIEVPTPTIEQNKATAQAKIKSTDWVNQPDVYDPTYDPHLLNRDEYLQYRSQIRAIAINPSAGPIEWPTEPTPQWSQQTDKE